MQSRASFSPFAGTQTKHNVEFGKVPLSSYDQMLQSFIAGVKQSKSSTLLSSPMKAASMCKTNNQPI